MPGRSVSAAVLLSVLGCTPVPSLVARKDVVVEITRPSPEPQPRTETISTTAELMGNRKTTEYLGSRSIQATLYRHGIEKDRLFALQQDCKGQHDVQPLSIVVLSEIELPAGKWHPARGVWLMRYTFTRCDESKVYNTAFFASDDGEAPSSQAYYPGTTNAHPILVKDAMPSATVHAAIHGGGKDCKSADVFDMRVSEPAHDISDGTTTFKGVWTETWTFKACGSAVDVLVTFVPDSNRGGTTFMIKMR